MGGGPSAGKQQWLGRGLALGAPVLALQPDHALAKGIHQVVMGPVGEPQQFADQVVVAAAKRQLSGLQQRGHGMGAAHLAASRPHSNQPRDLAPQQLADGRAIGGVLDRTLRGTNQRLAASGLQIRNDEDNWQLTKAGRDWGIALTLCSRGERKQRILWDPAVVTLLEGVHR